MGRLMGGGATEALTLFRMLAWPLALALVAAPLAVLVRQDMRRFKIKDWCLAWLFAACAGVALIRVGLGAPWIDFLGGVVAFGIVGKAIRELSFRATGRDSFGEADVLIMTAAGAALGWQPVLMFLLAGSLLGIAQYGLIAISRRRRGKRPRRYVPAGPAFAAALFGLLLVEAAAGASGFPFIIAR